MARDRPRSSYALLEVNGVGEQKARRYGQAFLKAIAEFEAERDR